MAGRQLRSAAFESLCGCRGRYGCCVLSFLFSCVFALALVCLRYAMREAKRCLYYGQYSSGFPLWTLTQATGVTGVMIQCVLTVTTTTITATGTTWKLNLSAKMAEGDEICDDVMCVEYICVCMCDMYMYLLRNNSVWQVRRGRRLGTHTYARTYIYKKV